MGQRKLKREVKYSIAINSGETALKLQGNRKYEVHAGKRGW